MNARAETPIPATEPALSMKYTVRIPVQVKAAGNTAARGWALHHLSFDVDALNEAEAVKKVMGMIRNITLTLPVFEDVAADRGDPTYDDFAEPDEPAVP